MDRPLDARLTDTGGDPDIDPDALGKLAKQAGVSLGQLAGKAGGTGGKVLSVVGEGLSAAGTGAGVGAAIGSVIPGIGNVIGGAIGAIGGAIVGVFHAIFGGGPRDLSRRERQMLLRGLRIYKKRHLPGAFQDAVLYVYHPSAYKRLRRRKRLPGQIEARLLKKRAYAARAKKIDRIYGARLRRMLAHLPPDFRTLIGVASVTGHSRDLYFALRRALAERARLMRQTSATPTAPASPEPQQPVDSDPPASPKPPEPEAPAMPGQDDAPEGFDALPIAPDDGDETGEPHAPFFMRSVVAAVDAGDAVFAWRPIRVTSKPHPRASSAETLLGTFWVFVDALKDRVTGLRWPCSAAETQMVADRIRVAPRHLPHWWGPLYDEELPCLMMTTRLMCARWLHARQTREVIVPHPDSTADLLIAGCVRMNRAIEADLARLGIPDPWVADPGKIWALHRRLFDGTSAGAINYGWHVDPFLTPYPLSLSTHAAIPGVSLIQSAGGTHPPDHIDYSQLLMLVAPWCMVAGPGQDQMVPMRTADVYRSRALAGLVTDDALPLPSVRQPFDPARVGAARGAFWAEQQRIYEGKRRRGLGLLAVRPRSVDTGAPTPQRVVVVPKVASASSPHDPFASLSWGRRST